MFRRAYHFNKHTLYNFEKDFVSEKFQVFIFNDNSYIERNKENKDKSCT